MNIGSVGIELKLERAKFDTEIKSLSNLSSLTLPVKVKLDAFDFNRQVKGLTGFAPSIDILVKLDTSHLKKQLEGVKTQVKIDCIPVDICPNINELNRKLQSAAKELDCIPVDICPDVKGLNSKLKNAASQLGCIPVDICPDFDKLDKSLAKKLSGKYYSVRIDIDAGGFGESITKSIKEGFKQVKVSSPSGLLQGLGSVLGGASNLIFAPLKGIATGAFEGIGIEVSKKLGIGLAKGIESRIGDSIGSFELLGETIATKVAPKIGETIGGKIVKSIFSSPIVRQIGDGVKSLIDENDALIEANSLKRERRKVKGKRLQEATREVGQNLVDATADIPAASVKAGDFEVVARRAKYRLKANLKENESLRKKKEQESQSALTNALNIASPKFSSEVGDEQMVLRNARKNKRTNQMRAQLALQQGENEKAVEFTRRADLDSESIGRTKKNIKELAQKELTEKPRQKLSRSRKNEILSEAQAKSSKLETEIAVLDDVSNGIRAQIDNIEKKLASSKTASTDKIKSILGQLQKLGINVDAALAVQAQFDALEQQKVAGVSRANDLIKQRQSDIKEARSKKAKFQDIAEKASEKGDSNKLAIAKAAIEKQDQFIASKKENISEILKFKSEASQQIDTGVAADQKIFKQLLAKAAEQASLGEKSLPEINLEILAKAQENLENIINAFNDNLAGVTASLEATKVAQTTFTNLSPEKIKELQQRRDELKQQIKSNKESITRKSPKEVIPADKIISTNQAISDDEEELTKIDEQLKPVDLAAKAKVAISRRDKLKSAIKRIESRKSSSVTITDEDEETGFIKGAVKGSTKRNIELNDLLEKLEDELLKTNLLINQTKEGENAIALLEQNLKDAELRQSRVKNAVAKQSRDVTKELAQAKKQAPISNTTQPSVQNESPPIAQVDSAVGQSSEIIQNLDKAEEIFKQVFDAVVQLTEEISGQALQIKDMPTLMVDDLKPLSNGEYRPLENSVRLGSENFKKLQLGDVTEDIVKVLAHEIRHALQFEFGENLKGTGLTQTLSLATNEESNLRGRVEQSVASSNASPERMPHIRKLEEDAYAFENRYGSEIYNSIVGGSGIKPVPRITPSSQQSSTSEIEALRKDLLIQLQAPQIKRIGKDLGLKNVSKTKQDLVSDILDKASPEDIKAKLPRFEVPTEQIVEFAQELISLPASSLQEELSGAISKIKDSLLSVDYVDGVPEKISELQSLVSEIREYEKVFVAALTENLDEKTRALFKGYLLQIQKQGAAATYQIKPLQAQQVNGIASKQNLGARQAVQDNISLYSFKDVEEQSQEGLKNISRVINNARRKLKRKPQQDVTDEIAQEQYEKQVQEQRSQIRNRRLSVSYGLEELPPVSASILPPKNTPKSSKKSFFQSAFNQFNSIKVNSAKKQAELLTRQADILLGEIESDITQGKSSQKEIEVLQSQLQENEKNLNKILNTVKRANAGKENALTPGDLQRLSGKAEELINQIDEDRQTIANKQAVISRGKELQPIARRLKDNSEQASYLSSKNNLDSKDLKQLNEANSSLREGIKDLGDEPQTGFDLLNINLEKITQSAWTAVKSFLAFSGLNFIRNFLQNIGKDAFLAYVELDRLKTALNFASRSKAAGQKNLEFVNKVAEDLGSPLQASQEGFTQLASASRMTPLEGEGSRQLFLGVSQASTTLSLSGEDTKGALSSLSTMMSKGKVSAEELRNEIANKIPGAMGIAARSVGVTEEEFNRLLESGQLLSQDFLPKFGKQLQAEFGDAATVAGDNAQSALFKVENSILSFKQSLGEGIAPPVIAGLNIFSTLMKGIAKIGKELGIIIFAVSTALTVNLGKALYATIAQLIATKAAGGTLGGAFSSLASTINKSFSAQITVGLFAALEIINLLSQAVSTELTKSFDDAAKSASRAAEESEKAFEKPKPEDENKGSEPEASSDVGKFLDNTLVKYANFYAEKSSFGLIKKPVTTYGEQEKQNITKNTEEIISGNNLFLSGAKLRLAELKSGKGEAGKLPGIDKQLQQAEQQRQALQAKIQRDFVVKGQIVPAEFRQQLEGKNTQISDLTNQRASASKQVTLDLTRADQQINSLKSRIEDLKSAKGIAAVGGSEAALQLTEQYKSALEQSRRFKTQLETDLAALRVDPILAFNSALRALNLTLAETQEKSELAFNQRRGDILKTQLSGFSTNKLASRQGAIALAEEERKRAASELQTLENAVKAFDEEASKSDFQSTLQRLDVSPDSSAAKIDDLLKNAQDESDKDILEKLKAGREQKNRLPSAGIAVTEADARIKQSTQDLSLFQIQDSAANQQSVIQRTEAKKLQAVKMAQQMRVISEEQAAEQMARIQLNTTEAQKRNIDQQLATLRGFHSAGKISAEEFHQRQRDLTDQQVNIEKQTQEQRLAVIEASNRRRLAAIELANRKAEATISLSQTQRTTAIKQGVRDGSLTQEQSSNLQNEADQSGTTQRIDDIKRRIKENKQLRQEGLRDSRTSTETELQLNQELAQANQQLIDQQIQGQQQLRDAIDKTFQRRKQQLDLEQVSRVTDIKQGILNATFDSEGAGRLQNQADQQGTRDRINVIKQELAENKSQRQKGLVDARAYADKELALKIELANANQQLIDQQIQGQQQLRDAIDKTFQRRKQQLDLEQSQADTSIQAADFATFNSSSSLNLKGLELDTNRKSLENRSQSQNRQLALVKEQLDGIDKLKLSEQQAADKKRELLVELDRLRKEQISTQKELVQNQQETEINGIERLTAADDNRHKLKLSQIDQQKSKLEILSQSLDLTGKLEESRFNLGKALSDASLIPLESKRDNANRALELSRKAKDEGLDPAVRSEINSQLSSLGFGTNELSILQKRSQIEDEIAAKKLEALKLEQEYQRKSLQLDLRRQRIAAQTAIHDAQSAELSAQKSRLEAESAFRIAQIKKDDVGMEAAKVSLQLASREMEIAGQKLSNAQENLAAQDELADNAVRAQNATQQAALFQQQAAESARKQSSALERVEALASGKKSSGSSSGSSIGGGESSETPEFTSLFDAATYRAFGRLPGQIFEGSKGHFGTKDGESIFDTTIKQAMHGISPLGEHRRVMLPPIHTEVSSKEGVRSGEYVNGQRPTFPPRDQTAKKAEESKVSPASDTAGASQFAEALKSANKGIEERLDKLSASIISLANTPRSLHVTSPQPVGDAAKIFNDISRNNMVAAGL